MKTILSSLCSHIFDIGLKRNRSVLFAIFVDFWWAGIVRHFQISLHVDIHESYMPSISRWSNIRIRIQRDTDGTQIVRRRFLGKPLIQRVFEQLYITRQQLRSFLISQQSRPRKSLKTSSCIQSPYLISCVNSLDKISIIFFFHSQFLSIQADSFSTLRSLQDRCFDAQRIYTTHGVFGE